MGRHIRLQIKHMHRYTQAALMISVEWKNIQYNTISVVISLQISRLPPPAPSLSVHVLASCASYPEVSWGLYVSPYLPYMRKSHDQVYRLIHAYTVAISWLDCKHKYTCAIARNWRNITRGVHIVPQSYQILSQHRINNTEDLASNGWVLVVVRMTLYV